MGYQEIVERVEVLEAERGVPLDLAELVAELRTKVENLTTRIARLESRRQPQDNVSKS